MSSWYQLPTVLPRDDRNVNRMWFGGDSWAKQKGASIYIYIYIYYHAAVCFPALSDPADAVNLC